ncbi:MAG: hypothetical protein JJ959_05805 [Nisaea sp.]|uniref:hypothetical protein n=1 Tax=Nisaea sp. TaxID=2024842 RepID=UPI001B04E871|nr:hypothetical protein [Nisaea sp.]MBO6560029.1 hypothetical protein [Nisaea sp.]
MRRRTTQLQSFALRQMQFQLPLSAFGALGSCRAGCGLGLPTLDQRSLLLCLYLLR